MEEIFDPLITKHVEGLLTDADRRSLAQRLEQDPDFAVQFALAEALIQHKNRRDHMAASKVKLQEKLSASAPQEISRPTWSVRHYARAAAAACVLIIAGYFLAREFILTDPSSAEGNYQAFYEPLNPSGLLSGNNSDSPEAQRWQTAADAFFKGRYEQAIAAAQPLTKDPVFQDRAQLLIGAAYLEINKPDIAEQSLQSVRSEALKYYRKAQLYLALALARQQKTDQAIAVLQALEKDASNPDRQKVIAFISALEKK